MYSLRYIALQGRAGQGRARHGVAGDSSRSREDITSRFATFPPARPRQARPGPARFISFPFPGRAVRGWSRSTPGGGLREPKACSGPSTRAVRNTGETKTPQCLSGRCSATNTSPNFLAEASCFFISKIYNLIFSPCFSFTRKSTGIPLHRLPACAAPPILRLREVPYAAAAGGGRRRGVTRSLLHG